MDCHAVPPPDYRELEATPSVKTCVSKIPSSSGQLEAAGASGSGRPVAAEDPSNTSEGKVHLQSNTDGEKYIQKFDDPANNLKPQSEEEHEFHNQVLDSCCARFGKVHNNLQMSRSTLRSGANSRATAYGLHLG